MSKRLNVPTSSEPAPFEAIYLPCYRENKEASGVVKVKNRASACNKSKISNAGRDPSKLSVGRHTGDKSESEDSPAALSPVFRDHAYSFQPVVKVRPLDSQGRRRSDELGRRLEELRERHERERSKIARLEMRVDELEKEMRENTEEETASPDLGRWEKPAAIKSSRLSREKEEYEKLLKDVREIKLKLLRERHDRESGKIRRLRIQMSNLREKMKENDEKEIAPADTRRTSDPTVAGPERMRREEEEYENLLRDVRKIKPSYRLRKQKQVSTMSDNSGGAIKCEKVLSYEDRVFIETMQKKSRFIKEIKDGNRLIHKIENGIDPMDYNEEYGEVIGEIDEDSIDIDMSGEMMILNFTDELPDPGLLDA